MTSETGKRPDEAFETETNEAAEAGSQTSATPGIDPSQAGARGGFADPAAAASADAERIEALEAENADVKDRLLRLAADMENLRRRTEREIKDARTYAVTGFAREMLQVADNLRRALEAVPAEAKADGEGGLTGLIDGVEVTERSLLSVLERNGVRRLEPEGQRFDPNFHQAMFEVPNPDLPNNTVVQVVQAGYAIGDRVLRPAMVGVSKGGPKLAAANGETQGAGAQG